MTPAKLPWWKTRSRFTLRALLVAVTLFMVWGGYHTNRGRQERAAVELLRQGGAKFFDMPTKGSAWDKATTWDHATWYYTRFVAFVWREPVAEGLALYHPPSPAEIEALGKLTHLKTAQILLDAGGVKTSPLPPGCLKCLLANRQLQGVILGHCELSDEDCRALGAHPNLLGISLPGCSFSEEGFAALLQAPRVIYLRISDCPVTGEKLARVPGSATLEQVMSNFAPLGPEFAAFIARSPQVKSLECEHLQHPFDGTFITAIGPHPKLACLILRGTCQVTPAILHDLKRMPALELFIFDSPNFTDADRDELKAALPGVEVR
jgi:hypothetical protein